MLLCHSCLVLCPHSIARLFDRRLHHFEAEPVVAEVHLVDDSPELAIIAEKLDIWRVTVGHQAVALQDRAIDKIDRILVADFKHSEG